MEHFPFPGNIDFAADDPGDDFGSLPADVFGVRLSRIHDVCGTLGSFIRGKIRRVLHRTRLK